MSAATFKEQAIALLNAGRLEEAVAALDAANRIESSNAEIWCLLGAAHGMRGTHENAIDACLEAIRLQPRYAEAWCNLGASQYDLGRYTEAIQSLSEALRLRPQYPGALFNLANCYRDMARYDEAIDCYRKGIAIQPSAETYLNLGTVFERSGKLSEAIDAYDQALSLQPGYADAHNNIANAYAAKGDRDNARRHYERAITLKPDYADAYNNYGVLLFDMKRIGASIEHHQSAIRIRPGFAEAWNNLGNAEQSRGHLQEALAAYEQALRIDPNHRAAQSNALYAIGFDPDRDPIEVTAEHRRWGQQFATRFERCVHANNRDQYRRLRVGYLSPDLRSHSVAYFVEPVIRHHDKNEFEVFCYADVARPDVVTERIRGYANHWRNVFGVTDDALTELIQRDGIDILIELSGHTANNRLAVIARKPAPIQINYIGYTQTTGLPTVDYYLTDGRTDPPGTSDALFTESLVRLPEVFCCYQPVDDISVPPVPPLLLNKHVTLGALHSLAKVNSTVIAAWSDILLASPGTRLLLQAPAFTDSGVRQEYERIFEGRGVTLDRLELIGDLPLQEYRDLHAKIDLALDTFPWSGHTSLCEMLCLGIPVIALRGSAHPGRKAASLLECVGLEELVANNANDYVSIAVSLIRDRQQLIRLRSDVRKKMFSSPIIDAPQYVHHLEYAYREMWGRWCIS